MTAFPVCSRSINAMPEAAPESGPHLRLVTDTELDFLETLAECDKAMMGEDYGETIAGFGETPVGYRAKTLAALALAINAGGKRVL